MHDEGPGPEADIDRRRRSGPAALVVLGGAPLLATATALARGPWEVVLFGILLPGALWVWLRTAGRRLRDLFPAPAPGVGPWVLLAAGAALGTVRAGVDHSIALHQAGSWWEPVDPRQVLAAALGAVLVGGLATAVPEELTLRGMLFEPVRGRYGGLVAVTATAVAFTALHLPTWLASGATLPVYAYQVPQKLLFGLVTGWSVLRLGSLLLALGLHLGGNVVGVTLSGAWPVAGGGWTALSPATALALAGHTVAAVAVVLLLSRRRAGRDPGRPST